MDLHPSLKAIMDEAFEGKSLDYIEGYLRGTAEVCLSNARRTTEQDEIDSIAVERLQQYVEERKAANGETKDEIYGD